jgi:hypothetical protein
MALLWPTSARADNLDEARSPMPEPIVEETTTDIDGRDVGELEYEANAVWLRSRVAGAFDLQLSAEVEWLIVRRFGVKLEPFYERGADAGASTTTSQGITGSASLKLVQDFKDDFHLQAEASWRVPTDVSTTVDPGESPLPFSFDLRSGFRRAGWTLRNSLGVSAGAVGAHVPIHGSAALLTEIEPSGTCGFWGVEVEADGARPNPVLVALELVPSLLPAGLPFSLGFVLIYSVAADPSAPSYGFMVRLFVESERERDYGGSVRANP